jgi:hypothetical protein
MPTRETTLRSIDGIAEAVRNARVQGSTSAPRIRAAIEHVALVVRGGCSATVEAALAAIDEALLRPIDPSALEWTVFRLFDSEDLETRWTTWLASILSPEHGQELSALVWRSLCDAVVRHGTLPVPCNQSDRLATRNDWREARETILKHGSVDRELADSSGLGRLDIAIDAPGIFVVLENKLDAGWSDRGGERQVVRYRQFGLTRRSPCQKLGLVLLTKNADFALDDDCRDYVRITYRDLARALRQNLRATVPASMTSALALAPALLTIAAIEQDLLGLDIARSRRSARHRPIRSLALLDKILAHLREDEVSCENSPGSVTSDSVTQSTSTSSTPPGANSTSSASPS